MKISTVTDFIFYFAIGVKFIINRKTYIRIEIYKKNRTHMTIEANKLHYINH